jgi:hypothetical protein
MSLTDSVLRPVAAFILAATIANCNDGCILGWKQLSPADAYAMEVSGCVNQRNRNVMACATDAGSMEDYQDCRADAEEQERQCRSMVDKKYLGYNSQGGYPSEPFNIPPR